MQLSPKMKKVVKWLKWIGGIYLILIVVSFFTLSPEEKKEILNTDENVSNEDSTASNIIPAAEVKKIRAYALMGTDGKREYIKNKFGIFPPVPITPFIKDILNNNESARNRYWKDKDAEWAKYNKKFKEIDDHYMALNKKWDEEDAAAEEAGREEWERIHGDGSDGYYINIDGMTIDDFKKNIKKQVEKW